MTRALLLLSAGIAFVAAVPSPGPSTLPLPPATAPANAPLPVAITPAAKTDLFDGASFAGWVCGPATLRVSPGNIWSIRDGILACTGRPNAYLRTEKSYTQYKLTVEWRFTRAGNTGVLVHINPTPALPVPPATQPVIDRTWPMCIECQGAHDHQGDFWIWSGAKVNEPLRQRNGVIMTKPSAEKPLGEWNTYEVLCKDNTVTILVNGTEMNKVTGTNLNEGQIGLQSEGAAIEVRKVTIEPL
jgi:hypothetical protein